MVAQPHRTRSKESLSGTVTSDTQRLPQHLKSNPFSKLQPDCALALGLGDPQSAWAAVLRSAWSLPGPGNVQEGPEGSRIPGTAAFLAASALLGPCSPPWASTLSCPGTFQLCSTLPNPRPQFCLEGLPIASCPWCWSHSLHLTPEHPKQTAICMSPTLREPQWAAPDSQGRAWFLPDQGPCYRRHLSTSPRG